MSCNVIFFQRWDVTHLSSSSYSPLLPHRSSYWSFYSLLQPTNTSSPSHSLYNVQQGTSGTWLRIFILVRAPYHTLMQTKGSATTPPQGPAHSQLSQKEIVAPPPSCHHGTMVPSEVTSHFLPRLWLTLDIALETIYTSTARDYTFKYKSKLVYFDFYYLK